MCNEQQNSMGRGSVILIVSLVVLSGCAATDTYETAGNDWGKKQPAAYAANSDSQATAGDIEAVFRSGTSAYRGGDLDGAETHFRAVLQRNPHHSRATYNLSMIYLQRAYDGLQHYARIEPESERSRRARALVEQLGTLRAAK